MRPCISALIVVELPMAKQFSLALVASWALLTPLKAAPVCFVVGPVTFSNCQVSSTTSPLGLPPMTFSFSPGTFNVPPGSFNTEVMITGPSYFLSDDTVSQSVAETLTADFSMEGYRVALVTGIGVAQDTGVHVSENIFTNAPCSALIASGTGVTFSCTPPSGLQSGSLSVTLEIHSTVCPQGPFCDAGQVGGADIILELLPVPEPSAFVLMSLGVIGAGLARRRPSPIA